MKRIKKLDDLIPYGIIPLTGESCRIGRRILCDLTFDGKQIVSDLIGAKTINLAKNWNAKGEYSFMLPYTMVEDLAVWCLIHSGCKDIRVVRGGSGGGVTWDSEVIGLETDEDREKFEIIYNGEFSTAIGRTFTTVKLKDNQPGHGTRCEHTSSGRIS